MIGRLSKYLICLCALYRIKISTGIFVINTWSGVFEDATSSAYNSLLNNSSAVDAVVDGCATCEDNQCDTSVGYGNHPDTRGFTSLDAMIMDGNTFDVGSVGYIRKFRNAVSIARYVMQYTSHTLLVGDGAEEFARMMGFREFPATDKNTIQQYKNWINASCQPNYYENLPEAQENCGPYYPPQNTNGKTTKKKEDSPAIGPDNHDTISMITMDFSGSMACGTTTNGVNHKVAGRVGDSPITGAGCYVDTKVGGSAATGDGDIMMRFLPTFYAVTLMETGVSPTDACDKAIARITAVYSDFSGGLVCVNNKGEHGGAANNMSFSYSFFSDKSDGIQVFTVA